MSERTTPPTPPAETTEDGAPIRSHADRMYGPPRAAHLAFGAPQPLIAYAVPFVAVAIVAALIAMTALAGVLSIGNGEIVPLRNDSGSTLLVGAGLLALALVIAHAYGITAATLVLLARSDGRALSARDAWVGAARRPWSVALAAVVSAAITVIVAGITTVLLPVFPLAGVAALLVLVVIVIVTAPLLLAWPQVVAARKPLGAALGWAWRSTHMIVSPSAEPFRSPRVAIASTVLLTGLVTAGLTALGGLLPVGWWTPVVGTALSLVPTALAQVLLAGVTVRGVALREEGVAIAPLVSTAEPTSAAARAPRHGGPLWGIAVLLVPALLAGVLVWANPWRVPSYAVTDVPQVWPSSQIAPWADGTAVLSRLGGESSGVRLCSGATCIPETEMRSILPTAIAPAGNGGILSASWYPIEGPDDRSGRFELRTTYSSPDALREWAQPLPSGLTDDEVEDVLWDKRGMPGDERVLGGIDSVFEPADSVFARSNQGLLGVAIDASGEFPVIASVARPRESIDAVVSLDFCSDAECTESVQTTIPVMWGYGGSNSTSIDVALAPDGRTAVVSLADGESRDDFVPLRVLTATADGESTIETPDAEIPGDPSDFDYAYGTQVEIGADGLPVVLYRVPGHPTLRLFSCTDLSCAEGSTTDIDPPSDVLSSPTLAIDSTGRPLVGVIDETASVALLSCDDAACTSQTVVRLVGAVPTDLGAGEGFALSLDAEDRPLLAVGVQREGSMKKATWSGTVLECAAPRCGAD
ncbi:hypothetical protein CLV49_1772 [Labedella gwakjiensis]|uniref:Uncharacterized protein n=1 Tax=Labedella gwakjiensis TaxID=390269 RepID=A0A2P8GW20_9MICO|nr:hypothetical protein [Labedella gwakjiensis]PSL38158.1 hypothetical protein CLV49_1772 [Labedella gwakjiensis]RUQ87292.1 hypothetical protein ELQ93_10345 [Labedella gwakjiensis]